MQEAAPARRCVAEKQAVEFRQQPQPGVRPAEWGQLGEIQQVLPVRSDVVDQLMAPSARSTGVSADPAHQAMSLRVAGP